MSNNRNLDIGAMLRLVANQYNTSYFSNHETTHVYTTANTQETLDYINYRDNNHIYKKRIDRAGDIYKFKDILCYNCSENFKINKIKILMGEYTIYNINMELLEFINCYETVEYNGLYNKIINLEKLNLLPKFNVVAIEYSQIEIALYTNEQCEIKLNIQQDYLNDEDRLALLNNKIEKIKILASSEPTIFQSNQSYKIHLNAFVNGFIIKNCSNNIDCINKIIFKINNQICYEYKDKLTIHTYCKKLSNNTLYLPFNECNYDNDILISGLNTYRYDSIKIEFGFDNNVEQQIMIGAYCGQILRYEQHYGGIVYDTNPCISLGTRQYYTMFNSNRISTIWSYDAVIRRQQNNEINNTDTNDNIDNNDNIGNTDNTNNNDNIGNIDNNDNSDNSMPQEIEQL